MSKFVLSACDTGSANFFIPLLDHLKDHEVEIYAQAQAAEKFDELGVSYRSIPRVPWEGLEEQASELLNGEGIDAVLAGTSYGSSIDKSIVLAARQKGIPSAAPLDHWALYKERFSRVEYGEISDDFKYLPDQVWLPDQVALHEAVAAGHDETSLRIVGQPHLEKIGEQLAKAQCPRQEDLVVFISERVGEDYADLKPSFDEFKVLKEVNEVVRKTGRRLLVKMHPQEDMKKYQDLDLVPGTQIVGKCDLTELIHKAGTLVGIWSMLLLEASLVRDDVLSFLPDSPAEMFIGNRVGATRSISNAEQLEQSILQSPKDEGQQNDFSKKFRGSTQLVLDHLMRLVR